MKRLLLTTFATLFLFYTNVVGKPKKIKLGYDVYWELNSDGVITISGMGPMPDFKYKRSGSNSPWDKYKDQIKEVEIGSGITSVGERSFARCNHIKSVKLPESITVIGGCAFWGCSELTEIDLPQKVWWIKWAAFKGCHSLKSLSIIGDKTFRTDIDICAFEHCSNLTSVTIGENCNSFGESAFRGCTSLKCVEFSGNVGSIGDYCFDECSSLTNVFFEGDVGSIGDFAFDKCSSLTNVTFWGDVGSIGDFAFNNCSLTSLAIPISLNKIGKNAFNEFKGKITRFPINMLHVLPKSQARTAYEYGLKDAEGFLLVAGEEGWHWTEVKNENGRTIAYFVQHNNYEHNYYEEGLVNDGGVWIVTIKNNQKIRCLHSKGLNYDKNDTGLFIVEDTQTKREWITDLYERKILGKDVFADWINPCPIEGKYILFSDNNIKGIVDFNGNIIIPLSRRYKSISFNFNKFEYSMDGYVGTCNLQGTETSRVKRDETLAKSSTKKSVSTSIEKESASDNSTQNSSYSQASSSQKTEQTTDKLLYKGIYTKSSQSLCLETGEWTGESGMTFTDTLYVYSDYIIWMGDKIPYGGFNNGMLTYYHSYSSDFEYYIDEHYNVFLLHTLVSSEPFMSVLHFKTPFEKGETIMTHQSSNNNNSYTRSNKSTHSENRVQQTQSQKTKKQCRTCGGKGTCNVCNGNGWVTRIGMGHSSYCTNCRNHDGRCPWCNGRGEWYE